MELFLTARSAPSSPRQVTAVLHISLSSSLSAHTYLAAMDYQPVVVRKHARLASTKHNSESRHWRQFKHPVFIKEYAPVTSVHFSPSKPHRYAVTAATRVQIYAPRTQKVTKTISRFKDVARSGCIRGDGKLVVAGDDTGLIQVSARRSLVHRIFVCISGVRTLRFFELNAHNFLCRSSTSTRAQSFER